MREKTEREMMEEEKKKRKRKKGQSMRVKIVLKCSRRGKRSGDTGNK